MEPHLWDFTVFKPLEFGAHGSNIPENQGLGLLGKMGGVFGPDTNPQAFIVGPFKRRDSLEDPQSIDWQYPEYSNILRRLCFAPYLVSRFNLRHTSRMRLSFGRLIILATNRSMTMVIRTRRPTVRFSSHTITISTMRKRVTAVGYMPAMKYGSGMRRLLGAGTSGLHYLCNFQMDGRHVKKSHLGVIFPHQSPLRNFPR